MSISTVLIAPSGSIGQVTAISGAVYAIDSNGFVTITNAGDVNALLNAGYREAGPKISSAPINASGLQTRPLSLTHARNITGAALAAAAAANVFGYSITLATSFALVTEAANSNAKTDAAMLEFVVPPEYVAGQNLTATVNVGVVIGAGTLSVKTVAVNAYRTVAAGTQAADICATTAITLTSNSATDYAFTITGTTLLPGDRLVLKVTVAITETAASNVTALVNSVRVG